MASWRTPQGVVRDVIWLALLVGLAGCATNPVTGKKEFSVLSEADEIRIGQELDVEVRREFGIYEDRALQEYIETVGLRLARASERPNLPWHFAVVDVPAINAFALPGGYIYLTRGILPFLDSEAELAGVLGHEIGHVTARHAARAYSRSTGAGAGLAILSIFFPAARPFQGLSELAAGLFFLKFSRDDELQADRLGAAYNAREGYDPAGVSGMLTTLARIEEASDRRGVPNWLTTHPHPADRVERLQETLATLKPGAAGFTTGREPFLSHIDGLVFGDNPREGIVRGPLFLHPELRFAVRFPDGWEVTNGAEEVVAREPGTRVTMTLGLVDARAGQSIEQVAVRHMQGAGFRHESGAVTKIDALEAYVATYRGSVRGVGRAAARAAHIVHGRRIFLLAGVAPADDFARHAGGFMASIQSFRALSAREAATIQPNRLDLYTVQPGDTWQAIAARAGEGIVRATTLAIMNHSPVNEQPRPGSRIKIAVAG
jgi:predicted Zn-dependent protease